MTLQAANEEIGRLRHRSMLVQLNVTPKRCACGAVYDGHAWARLPLVGLHVDDEESIELRNCRCGSTIAVELPK